MEHKLAVVDLAAPLDQQLAAILEGAGNLGVFYVVNHGIPQETISNLFAASRTFFALPEEDKLRLRHPRGPGARFAFMPMGGTRLDQAREASDDREGWAVLMQHAEPELAEPELAEPDPTAAAGDAPAAGLSRVLWASRAMWPDAGRAPGVKEAVVDYFGRAYALSDRLLELAALSLGEPADRFLGEPIDVAAPGNSGLPWATVGMFHYKTSPPPAGGGDDGPMGVGAHKDRFTTFTLLSVDGAGPEAAGLQLLTPDGSTWLPVPPMPGAIIANVGLLLEQWTAGRFKGVVHRVVATGAERYSAALFRGPTLSTRIVPTGWREGAAGAEAARYQPLTMRDWVGRFDRLFQTDSEAGTGTVEVAPTGEKTYGVGAQQVSARQGVAVGAASG